VEAGRRRAYVGLYDGPRDPASGDMGRYAVVDREQVPQAVAGVELVCGEAATELAPALEEAGLQAAVAPVPPPTRRAGLLARLAHARLEAGRTDDPDTLQPLYLRSSQISVANKRWPA